MKNPPASEPIAALGRLDGCSLANAIEPFHSRLRNEGFMDGSIHCLFPPLPAMVGHAVTLKIRGSSPPTGSPHLPGAHRLVGLRPDRARPPGRRRGGRRLAARPGRPPGRGARQHPPAPGLRRRRDQRRRARPAGRGGAGLPFFAGCLSVSHSYVHIVEFGQAGHGRRPDRPLRRPPARRPPRRQSVPLEIAARLPAAAAKMRAKRRTRPHRPLPGPGLHAGEAPRAALASPFRPDRPPRPLPPPCPVFPSVIRT